MKLQEKYHLVTLFICSVLLLSSTVLIWGCSSLKQKLSKKGKVNIILSHQESLTDQSRIVELQERELIKYFGAYATILLKDGFRFSADSGLIGCSAWISIRSEGLSLERQSDSLNVERLKEGSVLDEAFLELDESESYEERRGSPLSFLWWLMVLPLGWLVYRFCVWWA